MVPERGLSLGLFGKNFFTHFSELGKLRESEACLGPFELL